MEWPVDRFAAALRNVARLVGEAKGVREPPSIVARRAAETGREMRRYGPRGPWW